MESSNLFKTKSTKIIYKNPWIEVREDQIIKQDGIEGIYGYVHVRKTVGIVPIDDHKNIYLCKQYRYIFKDNSWEIPRGFVDNEETPLQAAKRELKEEAGLQARKLIYAGSLRLSIGIIDEETRVFLAEGLTPISNPESEIQEVKKFTLDQISRMIHKHQVIDGLTVAAMSMIK